MPARVLLLAIAFTAPLIAQPSPSIVPRPVRLTPGEGWVQLCGATAIVADTAPPDVRPLGALASEILAHGACPADGGADARVTLTLEPETPGPTEGYRLVADRGGVRISAATAAGLFYGLQTLRQLVPLDGSGRVPHVAIEDAPRFPYRGMHLDVGRHVFPVAFIKRYVDLLASYKLNVFHWHLTDDQGWRLEVRKYPRLTGVGAWRRETVVDKQRDPYVGDGTPYGGYYTQDEVREVVAYAAARHVTVIPEIELPGHSLAALAAYPELACTEGPFEVGTRWGVFDDVYCPSERTFAFLEDVLTEVLELFPSPYIHIGGDEVPKRRWKESALAQEVIRREGLKDEAGLQSWFIRRIETILRARGRRLIGWDEILEGGLAPDATVMSWRGTAGGIEAARQGHDVVMSPGSHLYFDHYQGPPENEPLAIGGRTPLARVYAFEPIPADLSDAEARHVIGAQANVWTEYITSPAQVEYMALPRMLALAEVVWSPLPARDWADFAGRLPAQLARLDALGVQYRIPEPEGLDGVRLVLGDSVTFRFGSPLPTARVLWTAAGTGMGGGRIADGPVTLPVGDSGVRVSARLVLANGRLGPARTVRVERTTLRAASRIDPATLAPGLAYAYYERSVRRATTLGQWVPTTRDTAGAVALKGTERAEQFGARLTGLLRVPRDGVYEFALLSDDGSVLRVSGQTVVNHDGPHSASSVTGAIALAAGLHPFELLYFQGDGDRALELRMRRGDEEWRSVPPEWLYRQR
jgi:hexosaminidase